MRSFRRELKSLLKNIRGYRVLGYGPEVWGRYAPVMARITSSPCIIGHEMVTTSWSLGSLRSGHGPQTEELAHKKVDVIVIKMTRLHPKYPYFKLV